MSTERREMTIGEARAVLREYPDADLSAFRVLDTEGVEVSDLDAVASAEAVRSIERLGIPNHEAAGVAAIATRDRLLEIAQHDPGRVLEVFERIGVSAQRTAQLEALTDAEVAGVCEELADELAMGDALHDLLVQVHGRLRRAAGGVYRECSWCSREASLARPDGQHACDEHEGEQ